MSDNATITIILSVLFIVMAGCTAFSIDRRLDFAEAEMKCEPRP